MCASETWRGLAGRAVLVACLAGIVWPAGASADPGPGRMALLGREASRVAGFEPPRQELASAPWIGAAFCVGLMAAFFGTYCGMRLFAFGRCVERDGWREVTYRFRSTPLAIRGDVIPRMTGLLEELEHLGAGRLAKPAPVLSSTIEAPRVEPEPVRFEPITFARREEPKPPSRYDRARALLREGHDVSTIQVMTGLKLAEIDLVRSAPGLGGAP